MTPLAEIEARIEVLSAGADAGAASDELLALGEAVIEHWLIAHDRAPTAETKEGFRLLALHAQGARGEPSFNACRETCRELVYHYNLITQTPACADIAARLEMMRFVARHLYFFVSGKLEERKLGDFCCASRPLRQTEPS